VGHKLKFKFNLPALWTIDRGRLECRNKLLGTINRCLGVDGLYLIACVIGYQAQFVRPSKALTEIFRYLTRLY